MRYYDPKTNKRAKQIEKKTKPGQYRDPTITDARKLGLVPSVTTIIDTISKPMLYEWLQHQAFDSAWESAQTPISKEEAWGYYKQESTKVRDKGSELHDNMSRLEENEITSRLVQYLKQHYVEFEHEIEFCAPLYGGTIDMLAKRHDGTWDMIDFKFCSKLRKPYPSELWQMAAYSSECIKMDGAAINIIIDQNTGEFECYPWSKDEVDTGYRQFMAIHRAWEYVNNYIILGVS
jgi:hypothetical protein